MTQPAPQRTVTPLMAQYHAIKKQYPDTLVLFQVGDFYELFYDDAKTAAAYLGIALTKRGTENGQPIPLCGVPLHTRDFYLTKLVRGGFKVALCDQLEEAKPGTVVKRGITQVLTPGTLTESHLLDEKTSTYICALFPITNATTLIFAELLTGAMYISTIAENNFESLETELSRFCPAEIIVPDTKLGNSAGALSKKLGYFVTNSSYVGLFSEQFVNLKNWITMQFGTAVLQQFEGDETLKGAFTLLYQYLAHTQPNSLTHFKQLQWYNSKEFLIIDAATQRNLELVKNNQDGSSKHTLFSILDRATTGMGSRLIKKWLYKPLVNLEMIESRLDAVSYLVADSRLRLTIEESLKEIGDIERVIGRIALSKASLLDYIHLSRALTAMPQLKESLATIDVYALKLLSSKIFESTALQSLLENSLNILSENDWLIKPGFNADLDNARDLAQHGTTLIAALEHEEQQKTGIQSLKIRYTGTFGYYIEVTKANYHLVPDYFIRQQTLVGRERFTTPALKDLEHNLRLAETEAVVLEKALFENIKTQVAQYLASLQKTAHVLCYVDALASLATVAYEHGYVRPVFNADRIISIVDGRHPIVEQAHQERFIPNSTTLDSEQSVWIITGPNMGGKSTYLRQVALISVMAQIGSFVPAQSANLFILDRIFTRLGASDRVAEGKSTFLVEMEETATICNQATKNSLVILDEVGRGTSTFDGLAIAQAVVEYLTTQVQARCLFATHYHELTQLEAIIPGIVNYFAASSKTDNGILFLHKIIRGVAQGSFGIDVARLAHLPEEVINRASVLLHTFQQ